MSLQAHFSDLGLADEDARLRAAASRDVARRLEAVTGHRPDWAWFVPGRLEVFGKHTDYAGGQVLVAAVPRGFAVAARARDDQTVRVLDHINGNTIEITPHAEGPALRGWAGYVDVTARRLARNFPGVPFGIDLVFASDLPRAAGMSSSSALVIAVATAMAARGRLPERPEWRDRIRTIEERATYFGCIESGQAFGTLLGTSGVGTHGGSEDHTAILASRNGSLSHYRFVPTTRLADLPCPPGWTFVVGTSGVHADKAGSVRERYNHAADSARALLRLWNRMSSKRAASLAEVVDRPGAVDQLRVWISASVLPEATPAELWRRLDHFLAEDAIVADAAQACARGDAAAIGALAERSQRHAEELLDNQVPETRTLAALARSLGAHGATSFGAGFGGSVWALVGGTDVEAFATAWLDAYRRQYPQMPNVRWFAARPGPGLVAVPPAAE